MRYFWAFLIVLLMTACNPFVLKHNTEEIQATVDKDEKIHEKNSLEWWYFTGHLQDTETGEWFGIEYVYFHFFPLTKKDYVLINFAVTDTSRDAFEYTYEFIKKGKLENNTSQVSFQDKQYLMKGSKGDWLLIASIPDSSYSMALTTQAAKPVQFHDSTGYQKYGEAATAGYFSYPRLYTQGSIMVHGKEHKVAGYLWYDRQWNCGNVGSSKKLGWDWMSIDFDQELKNPQKLSAAERKEWADSPEQLMVYQVRQKGDSSILGGSIFTVGGENIPLKHEDIILKSSKYWVSPDSKRSYPVEWQLEVPKYRINATVKAVYPASELILKKNGVKLPYWEGMCTVEATVQGKRLKGKSYLEMTNRPKK